MLRNGAEWCAALDPKLREKWLGKVLDDIESDDLTDLLSAAYKITEKLGGVSGGQFRRWLHESVGRMQLRDKKLIEAIRDLKAPIATTNYDGLLEEVTGLDPVTWRDSARVQNVLQGREPAILHLHGYYRQPQSVVLGIKSYQETVNDTHAQTVLHALSFVKTLVFIGFGAGLRDPNFGPLLKWREATMPGAEARSYRLALDGERESLQKEHPPGQRIHVLAYGKEHRDLEPFLRRLVPAPAAKPVPPAPGTTGGLPPPRACFGRATEIEGLVTNLLAPQPLPYPVLGGPGIGKSTITIGALHDSRVISRYRARRYFVRCEAAPSRTATVAAIARLVGLDPAPGMEAVVLANLAAAPALLILDNFETPWEAEQAEAEELLGLLAAVPGLALVASVRGNERPGGLSWAEALRIIPLDPVAARQEFLDIAGRKFEADPLLDSLLAAVDCVPLAIHLLAHAAEPDPSLENLWQRWQAERTALLKRGPGTDRLTNIELSYEISWNGPRMTEDARRLLSVLAQLPAGVAAAHLSAINPADPGAATGLRACGLAYDEEDRLRILAPIREYVTHAHPPQAGDLEQAAAFYRRILIEHGPKVGDTGGLEAVRTLGPEAPNIEPMVLASIPDASAEELAKNASAWAEFARFTGVGSFALLERMVDAISVSGNPEALAQSLRCLATLYLDRSNYAAARERFEQALHLFREQGSMLGEANCIFWLGNIAQRSDIAAARERFEQALHSYQQAGQTLGQANCIQSLGDIALRLSEHAAARDRYEQALPLYRQLGSTQGEAACIQSLGDVALHRSDHMAANERYEQALPLYRQVGDLLGEANCIKGLGDIALRRSDHASAHRFYEQALPLCRRVGSVQGEANCIQGLGDIARTRSDLAEARRCYEEALALYKRIEDFLSLGGSHRILALIAENDADRTRHVQAAREAWLKIARPDLIKRLDDEFGAASAATA